MIKVKDFEVVKLAKRVVIKQLEFFNKMMQEKKKSNTDPWPFPRARDFE